MPDACRAMRRLGRWAPHWATIESRPTAFGSLCTGRLTLASFAASVSLGDGACASWTSTSTPCAWATRLSPGRVPPDRTSEWPWKSNRKPNVCPSNGSRWRVVTSPGPTSRAWMPTPAAAHQRLGDTRCPRKTPARGDASLPWCRQSPSSRWEPDVASHLPSRVGARRYRVLVRTRRVSRYRARSVAAGAPRYCRHHLSSCW